MRWYQLTLTTGQIIERYGRITSVGKLDFQTRSFPIALEFADGEYITFQVKNMEVI